MKTCDEMLNSLYERRAQYVTAQRKKKKVLASAGATLCAVSLLGGSVWYLNRPQHDIPVIPTPDENEVTTTIAAPTEGEDTTTTTTTVNTTTTTIDTTTVGGVVTPTTTAPTTTASSKIEPPKTTAPSKTDPTKTTASTKVTEPPKTTPSKTEPSKTNPTASQTNPTATQTEPTQTTGTTQTTTPPVEDDYIVVDPPIGSGEPMPIYTMSVKVPARCSVTDEYITVELSYGVPLLGMSPDDITATGYVELSLGHKKQKVAVLKVIDIKEMFTPQYDVEIPLDEDGWPTAFIYAHTETIQVPLSICSDRTGYIQFSLQDYTYEDNEFIFGGGGVSVWYTRMGEDIVFRSDIYWG